MFARCVVRYGGRPCRAQDGDCSLVRDYENVAVFDVVSALGGVVGLSCVVELVDHWHFVSPLFVAFASCVYKYIGNSECVKYPATWASKRASERGRKDILGVSIWHIGIAIWAWAWDSYTYQICCTFGAVLVGRWPRPKAGPEAQA